MGGRKGGGPAEACHGSLSRRWWNTTPKLFRYLSVARAELIRERGTCSTGGFFTGLIREPSMNTLPFSADYDP